MENAQAPPRSEEGFTLAHEGHDWQFPRDHGSHPDYRTEWWYWTGHLDDTATGEQLYGFHLTFFRTAVAPPSAVDGQGEADAWVDTDSAFALRNVYWAHFAVTDFETGEFYQDERLHREFPGVAEAATDTMRLRNGRWIAELTDDGKIHMRAEIAARKKDGRPINGQKQQARPSIQFDLSLTGTKGPLLNGENGFSRKGGGLGQASMYYAMPRLQAEGVVTKGGAAQQVGGEVWMDREYMTNSLSEDQVGWDWFAIQLSDGSEVMVYHIRLKDGPNGEKRVEPFSKGSYYTAAGTKEDLKREDYTIEVLDTWTSPHTGAEYPAKWRLKIAPLDLELIITPNMADQEMRPHLAGRTYYWEGSVRHEGTKAGAPITGRGYVELVGYGQDFQYDI